MNNKPNPTGNPGRRSRCSSPGTASNYRVHQSDENTFAGNLRTLLFAGAALAGLTALAIGFPGRKRVKALVIDLAQDATDDAQVALYEDRILENPTPQEDPALAANLIDLVEARRPILVCEIGREKGQRPHLARRQRGPIIVCDTANDIYRFAVTGHPEPIVFTIRDVRTLFNMVTGPCLAVGEA